VNAILLRRPPVAQPERLVEIHLTNDDFPFTPFSYPDYEDLERSGAQVFAGIAASQLVPVPQELGGSIQTVLAELVNGSYFPVLGLRPTLGRLLGPEDHVARGGHPVAVLAYEYWKRAFGGDPNVVGREIRLAGRSYTIVGVGPRDYEGNLRGLAPSVYLPILMVNRLEPSTTDLLTDRGNHAVFLTGRLLPGATLAQARTVVAGFAATMQRAEPDEWPASARVVLTPVSDIYVSPLVDGVVVSAAALLLAVVGLVLLIACANLASFLLAQARSRRREVAVRLALGARRRALVRQLLTESMVLALLGGAAGVLLAWLLLHLLAHADLPLPIPVTLDLSLDPVVLGFALTASLVAGVSFGLVPALESTRWDVMESLKTETVGAAPPKRGRISPRGALVVAQVAVAFVLLVTTSLFLRSFRERETVDPGFGRDPAAVVVLGLQSDRYTEEKARLFVRRLEERLTATAGISTAGVSSNIHLNPLSTSNIGVNVDGFTPPEGERAFEVDVARVDEGFLDAAGIPILRGRNFARSDAPNGPPVAVINEAMAQRFWPRQDPIGQVFRSDGRELTVIGVARTAKIRTLEEQPRPFVYLPLSQNYSPLLWLVARTRGDADQALPAVLEQLRALDPDVMILEAKTMERHLATMLLPARLGALTFTAFAALALALATIGVYGIVAYALRSRTREIGIRLSLGAQPAAAVRLLMGSGLRLVALGVVIGIALSALGARLLASFLYGVSAYDPVTFGAVPVVLVAVGALASYLPARRAIRVDPVVALKAE